MTRTIVALLAVLTLLLLTVPPASANLNDLDLTISGVDIDPIGGGYYRVKPHVQLSVDEFDTQISFDVEVDIGGTPQTHSLTFKVPTEDTPISRALCYQDCSNDCPTCCGFTSSCPGSGSCSCSYTNISEEGPVAITTAVTITITADVNGDVAESNEGNNGLTVQFTP